MQTNSTRLVTTLFLLLLLLDLPLLLERPVVGRVAELNLANFPLSLRSSVFAADLGAKAQKISLAGFRHTAVWCPRWRDILANSLALQPCKGYHLSSLA